MCLILQITGPDTVLGDQQVNLQPLFSERSINNYKLRKDISNIKIIVSYIFKCKENYYLKHNIINALN